MRGFSKAIIAGNLTRDPELRSTSTGSSVCSFGVAVNRTFRGADGSSREDVSYFDCSAWSKIGETIAQYAKKGSAVIVSGRLSQRSWEDKNGGKRSSVEIVVEDFIFAGGSRDGGSGSYGGGSSYSSGSSSYTSGTSSYAGAESQASKTEDIPDDIPEGEVDLSEIPF